MTSTPLTFTELRQGIKILEKAQKHWSDLNTPSTQPLMRRRVVNCFNSAQMVMNYFEDMIDTLTKSGIEELMNVKKDIPCAGCGENLPIDLHCQTCNMPESMSDETRIKLTNNQKVFFKKTFCKQQRKNLRPY